MKDNPGRAWTLLTDLYELTMGAAYYRQRMSAPATFSLFIRDYPPDRAFFVSAGLEEVLDFLESFSFSQEDLDYLESLQIFDDEFLNYLVEIRFTGDVRAIPEGRLFFKDEPILEVTAPIIEAQLVETYVINAINLQSCIATKALRCVHAAQGRDCVDFSLRRTQGTDAGMKVARASHIGGFSKTSNVLAGKRYGIPVSGTMAHSFVTSFDDETDSFRAFAETFPDSTVLLIDTYDTVQGAHKAALVGKEMAEQGHTLRGVRLDSGDMAALSKEVRRILDHAGVRDTAIFASGGFDEFKIADTIEASARIDAFGIGTKMGVSADAPYFDIAYKLVQYDGGPVLKLSSGKKTLVGEKQVFRVATNGRLGHDTIALKHEELPGAPLLMPVMKNGRRVQAHESLDVIRSRLREEFGFLDERYKVLRDPPAYPVELGPALSTLQKKIVHEVREKELGES